MQLMKLSLKQIESMKVGEPIQIHTQDGADKTWYILVNPSTTMPDHMLSISETAECELESTYADGIEICGIDCESGFCLWRDFGDTWEAYGYR